MTRDEILNLEPGPELDRLVAERVIGNPDLVRPQLREGAEVLVSCPEYDGWAIIKGFNDDDTCDVFIEGTGGKLRVHCDQIEKVVGQPPWSPSTDIAAAWDVIRRCNELGWAFELTQVGLYPKVPPGEGHGILWAVRLVRLWGGPTRTVFLEGPLLPTVCKAALLAIAGRDDAEAFEGQS